jgi:hypothetical protein
MGADMSRYTEGTYGRAAATVLARHEVEAGSADGGNALPDNLLFSRQDEGARPKCKRPSFNLKS